MSCLKSKWSWLGGWDRPPGVVECLPHALAFVATCGRRQAVGKNSIQNS